MKIFTATNHDVSAFARMFKDYGEVKPLPESPESWDANNPIDLLIFTGGADVSPTFYGSNRPNPNVNLKRDHRERDVFQLAAARRSPVNKVLGVCRGMQFLNVMMGGTLVHDIYENYGVEHPNVHALDWHVNTVFSPYLTRVNSMHHQAIYSVGEYKNYFRLAVEPATRIIEAILWDNRYLGFQFHPEYFWGDLEETRNKIAENIIQWVKGGSLLESPKTVSTVKKPISFNELYPQD